MPVTASYEVDELVTRQFLRAELAEIRVEMAGLRTEMTERFHQQTVWLGGAITAATALLAGPERPHLSVTGRRPFIRVWSG